MYAVLSALALLAASPDTVIRAGAPLPDRSAVPLGAVMQDPQSYAKAGEPVLVSGVVERVCTEMGCWMQVAPAPGEKGLQVNFKDHAFFIPMNAKGMKARAYGTIVVGTLGKAEADEREAEGAGVQRNADGTATEISLLATGVELTP